MKLVTIKDGTKVINLDMIKFIELYPVKDIDKLDKNTSKCVNLAGCDVDVSIKEFNDLGLPIKVRIKDNKILFYEG